jgi:hypothetical protein
VSPPLLSSRRAECKLLEKDKLTSWALLCFALVRPSSWYSNNNTSNESKKKKKKQKRQKRLKPIKAIKAVQELLQSERVCQRQSARIQLLPLSLSLSYTHALIWLHNTSHYNCPSLSLFPLPLFLPKLHPHINISPLSLHLHQSCTNLIWIYQKYILIQFNF